jgi:hypothetical protein
LTIFAVCGLFVVEEEEELLLMQKEGSLEKFKGLYMPLVIDNDSREASAMRPCLGSQDRRSDAEAATTAVHQSPLEPLNSPFSACLT